MELKDYLQHEQLSIHKLIKMKDIKQGIVKLHNQKSPRPNKIVNELIKYDGPVLIEKNEEFFNKIFKSKTILNQWREAILVNIDKGGQGGQGKIRK